MIRRGGVPEEGSVRERERDGGVVGTWHSQGGREGRGGRVSSATVRATEILHLRPRLLH